MSSTNAIHEYASLLIELHALIREGHEDSLEADQIRDAMDAPWYKLTDADRELINGLSADLLSIKNPHVVDLTTPDEAIPRPSNSSEWMALLSWLRARELNIPADQLAFLRGNAWVALRQFRVSEAFFREAYRLHPAEDSYGDAYAVVWIKSLEAIGSLEELDRLTTDFLANSKSSMRRVASVCARFQIAVKVPSFLARTGWQLIGNDIRRELDTANRGQSTTLDHLLDNAHICLGFICFLTGQRDEAEAQCRLVGIRAPEHPGVRELTRFLRGEITLNEEPESINRLVEVLMPELLPGLAA